MGVVHVVVPEGIDDPARPSGGNVYDRRLCDELPGTGWAVHRYAVPGPWPWPDNAARRGVADVLGSLPDGAVVLLDGLVASALPEVLAPQSTRLRPVVLMHMPLGQATAAPRAEETRGREATALSVAAAVVATSRWTRDWLVQAYALPVEHLHVAEPGADPADVATGSETGGRLLSIAAVTPGKGHDVLLDALAMLADLPWRCQCVGALGIDPEFTSRVRRRAENAGLADRVCFTGPRSGAALASTYAGGDLLVSASRAETFGMVVVEALARGLPVIATRVGGVGEALGPYPLPGLLVPPEEPHALASALRSWLEDPGLRARLRGVARARRSSLSGWDRTAAKVAAALSRAAG